MDRFPLSTSLQNVHRHLTENEHTKASAFFEGMISLLWHCDKIEWYFVEEKSAPKWWLLLKTSDRISCILFELLSFLDVVASYVVIHPYMLEGWLYVKGITEIRLRTSCIAKPAELHELGARSSEQDWTFCTSNRIVPVSRARQIQP